MTTSYMILDVDLSTDSRTIIDDERGLPHIFNTKAEAEQFVYTLTPEFNHMFDYKELQQCDSCMTFTETNNIYVMAKGKQLCECCYFD